MVDPTTKHSLGCQLSSPREDSVNNAGKRKRESEDPEEPRKKSRETLSLSQGPSQQTYEDSNTVKTCKRKREDTEERKHVKKIKLRSNQEDKPEDPSSNEKWPGVNRVVVRLTNSSDSSCSSDDGRCSLGTVEDFSRDRQKSLCFIVSNSNSKQELETERHGLSLSEEDEENSSTLLNADTERQRFSTPREGNSDGSVTALTSNDRTNRIVFEATYKQEERIGQGAYGSVFAGYRKCDKLPVAIKHIPVERIQYTTVSQHGKEARVPLEVALLLRLRDVPAVVTLLDWYDLGSEVVLVLERPEHCADLFDYVNSKRDLEEHSVKIIMQQLVDAFIEIHSRGVLHKDVHFKNILIEFSSTVPHIRIIDFGQGSFLKSGENRDTLTVLQLGHMVYNLLRLASRFTSSDITEDGQKFVSACSMVLPELCPSLRELQSHPWLIRLNQTKTNKDH